MPTKESQTKMFNRQKDFTKTLQNLIIGMYFYLSAITSPKKIALINLFFNNVGRLNHSSLMNKTAKKIAGAE